MAWPSACATGEEASAEVELRLPCARSRRKATWSPRRWDHAPASSLPLSTASAQPLLRSSVALWAHVSANTLASASQPLVASSVTRASSFARLIASCTSWTARSAATNPSFKTSVSCLMLFAATGFLNASARPPATLPTAASKGPLKSRTTKSMLVFSSSLCTPETSTRRKISSNWRAETFCTNWATMMGSLHRSRGTALSRSKPRSSAKASKRVTTAPPGSKSSGCNASKSAASLDASKSRSKRKSTSGSA
mmetsp:Transcript_13704/g.34712  ORF Transcript_13704/g.34712 Transcript_13704/m.34712 type:complete len:252 (+) Transcript_13704:826-1581(+)